MTSELGSTRRDALVAFATKLRSYVTSDEGSVTNDWVLSICEMIATEAQLYPQQEVILDMKSENLVYDLPEVKTGSTEPSDLQLWCTALLAACDVHSKKEYTPPASDITGMADVFFREMQKKREVPE